MKGSVLLFVALLDVFCQIKIVMIHFEELWAVTAVPNPLDVKQPEFADSILSAKPRATPRKKLKLPELPPELERRLKENERKTGVSDKAPTSSNDVLEISPSIAQLKSYTDKVTFMYYFCFGGKNKA